MQLLNSSNAEHIYPHPYANYRYLAIPTTAVSPSEQFFTHTPASAATAAGSLAHTSKHNQPDCITAVRWMEDCTTFDYSPHTISP